MKEQTDHDPVTSPLDGLTRQLHLLMPDARLLPHPQDAAFHRPLAAFPGSRRPRLLLPADRRAAAAAAVSSRRSAADGTRSRLARRGLSLALRAGGGRLLGPRLHLVSDGVPELVGRLAEAAGVPVHELSLSVAVGASRANAKPVLAVHAADGRVVLWAKLATNPLTATLVRTEHAALQRLSTLDPQTLRVPRPLGLLEAAAGPALLMEPLRGRAAPPRGAARVPVAAFAGLALAEGVREVSSRSWLDRGDGAVRDELHEAWVRTHPGRLALGAWHGDWGPWNMSWAAAVPQVWDWERYSTAVPVGVDAVHFVAHTTLRERDLTASLRRLDAAGPTVAATLRHAGVPADPSDVAATVDAYLLLVRDRFASEGALEPSGAVLRLARHYDAVLRARLTDPSVPRPPAPPSTTREEGRP